METIKYRNHTIHIKQDTDSVSPRDWDNIGTLALFHRRLNLGDSHGLSIDEVKEIADSENYISVPVFGYEHGGITIQCAPYSCRWDSGQLGIIFVSREKARAEFGTNYKDDSIRQVLRGEVETYDDYLTGNIWGYVIKDSTGEEIASCWGFVGDPDYCISEAKSMVDYNENERVESIDNYVTGE